MYSQSSQISVAGIFCLCFAVTLIVSSSAVNFTLKHHPSDIALSGNVTVSKHRITNGRNIRIREAPYFVQISDKYRKLFCGGTLVSNITVITAAHCVQGKALKNIKITANADRINEGGQVRRVVDVYIHPDYNSSNWHADAAVLRVNIPFVFAKGAGPVLMCSDTLADDEDIEIVGWGKTSEESMEMPRRLQSIMVKGISYEKCAERMNITETMVCSDVSDGKDACQGDSGGPVISVKNHCLTATVSWGRGCGRTGVPGVLTSINKVRAFIRQAREYERKQIVKVIRV